MIYTPDVKAPRYRRPAKRTIVNDVVKAIKQEVFSAKYIEDKLVKEIIYEFNCQLVESAIENRDGVEVPSQIGHIFIGTCPMKKSKNIDFKITAIHKKAIQHRNWESDNYLAKIFFTTYSSKYKFKNNELWGFYAIRDFKRKVGKTYPANWKKYVQVDPKLKIGSVFRENMSKLDTAQTEEDLLKTYNEFEF